MARKVITQVLCDLHDEDQIAGTQTIRFGLDGKVYEIDACQACAAELQGAFSRFLARARRTGTHPVLLPPWPRPRPGRTRKGHVRRDQLDADEVIRAYRDEKLTMDQCAGRFRTSRRIIELVLDEHGIKRRPRGRAPTQQTLEDLANDEAFGKLSAIRNS